MSHIDPAVLTQLIIAIATLATALAGWLKSQSNSRKIDSNTDKITDIHAVTNGSMQKNFADLSSQANTNAATAAATATAAKTQAAIDASASKDRL